MDEPGKWAHHPLMRGSNFPGIAPEDVLKAYRLGYFPMSESRESDDVFWVLPDFRGVLPLDGFHLSRSLRKKIRHNPFEIKIDSDFRQVMLMCQAPATEREDTWINNQIVDIYCQLFQMGYAHSVEAWQNETLVGGLYGVSIGGAFFGESMFSRVTDASKVALAYLVARLRVGGYKLLDTQFTTEHLISMGVTEIAKADYEQLLEKALGVQADFFKLPVHSDGSTILQSITQTS